jgi:hypothetical protein
MSGRVLIEKRKRKKKDEEQKRRSRKGLCIFPWM